MKECINKHLGFDEKMKLGIQLFVYLGQFRKKCEDAVKELVDDLIFKKEEFAKFYNINSWADKYKVEDD